MTLHREGNKILLSLFLILAVINLAVFWFTAIPAVEGIVLILSLGVFILFAQFFRVPPRRLSAAEGDVVCPADGKVVAIEEVEDPEYFKSKVIQISVFMSPLNVHVNYNPIGGVVRYFKYHPGLYLVAWHPKSSTENERTTVVTEDAQGRQVLYRQIAGAVARRICWYVDEGTQVEKGKEFGFIKFGSRVDILLPLNSDIQVKIGQKVKAVESVLAKLG